MSEENVEKNQDPKPDAKEKEGQEGSFSPLGGDDQRKRLYDEYNKLKTETSPEEEDTGEESGPGKEEDSAGSSPGKEEEKGEKETEEPKKVPYDALHQERERRKQANRALKELEKQNKELQKRMESLEKNRPQQPFSQEEEESLSDSEKRLLKQNRELQEKLQKFSYQEESSEAEKQRVQVENKINEIDKKLADNGYPGFGKARLETDKKLKELYEANELNMNDINNPDVWERVYKEDVFPEYKALFVGEDKTNKTKEKSEKKKGLKSPSNPGKAPEPEKPKEAKSMDDINREFQKRRREQQQRIGT